MPAFASHYIFFNELKDFLSDNADFKFCVEAAAIGTQGPDIFFFHKLTNPKKTKNKVGVALHNSKPAEILEAMAEYLKTSKNLNVAKSYIYGFILHYALDRNCHPFVFAFQEKQKAIYPKENASTIHNKIEVSIDSYLLSKKLGIDNSVDFDAASTITVYPEILDEIASLIAYIVPKVTNETVNENEVFDAICDTHKVQELLRNKNGWFGIFLKIVDKIIAPISKNYKLAVMIKPNDLEQAKKYANMTNNAWVSPFDEDKKQRNESFVDLFNYAIDDAKMLICAFNEMCDGTLNGYNATKNISFLTGTEVK